MRPKGTAHELERRRRRVLALLEQGKSVTTLAEFFELHPKTIYRWKREVDRQGPKALDPKPQTGRRPKLTAEQLAELEALLVQGAKAHGFPDDLWSGRRVQQLIARHFGVDYHLDHVGKLLNHKLRFSSQKPEKKAAQRDDWDIAFFRDEKFDLLLDHAREHQAHLVFLDEAGFQLEPNVRRGYSRKGHTPVFTCSSERQRISVISCVTLSPDLREGDLHFQLLDPNENVCAEDIVTFLDQLHEQVPQMLVVWDGAPVHARSRLVREYLESQPGIDEETLPAYAPEFNPDEYVWSYLKHSRMYHYAPNNVIDLYDRLEHELVDLSTQPNLLRGFINHSELNLRLGV